MTFSDDLTRFAETVEDRLRSIFVESVNAVHGSVVDGSEVTAAPGQPVDTGNLKASWQETFPEDWVGQTATNVEYAPAIEEGQQEPYTTPAGTEVQPGPMTLRSEVGGFHSVKLTRENWDRLAESVRQSVVGTR